MIWFYAITSALFIGLSKGGLKGLGPVFILLMVEAFGGKSSTGIVLLLLMTGDLLALYYYKTHIQKKYVIQVLPWVLGGVLIGTWLGKDLSETVFRQIIAAMIILSMGSMALWDLFLKKDIKLGIGLTAITGTGTGLFSMLGNFGGAFSNIYFLLTKLPKNELIATSTVIYFIMNIFKLPFHIFYWGTVDQASARIDLILIPAVVIGFFIGKKVVSFISEKWFRRFLYLVTLLGAIWVLLK